MRKHSSKSSSKSKTANAPPTQPEVQLPKEDPIASEAPLPEKPARNQLTVQQETPDERTDASSATSTIEDDSEIHSSSSSESSEKTPSVKSEQQHEERAKFLQRMFADIEEGGCQQSVSSG